jgi:diaminopimelate epimerase
VDDAEAVDLAARGLEVEHHPLFPARTNVQFASLIGPDHLRMRVWERGTGITLASGSSSCAVAVAAARRGLTGRAVKLTLDGGDIWIDWREDGVWMTGPTAHVFTAELTADFISRLQNP